MDKRSFTKKFGEEKRRGMLLEKRSLELRREAARQKLPPIVVREQVVPTKLTYNRARSTTRHIISNNFL